MKYVTQTFSLSIDIDCISIINCERLEINLKIATQKKKERKRF